MSGTDWAIVLLAAIDVAALSVGLSIRRKVVRIITDVGRQIEGAVNAGIAQAISKLAEIAAAMLAPNAAQAAKELVERLTGPGGPPE